MSAAKGADTSKRHGRKHMGGGKGRISAGIKRMSQRKNAR